MIEIRMLKDDFLGTDRYARTAIRAFILINDISPGCRVADNSALRAGLSAFPALNANMRLELAGIRKFRFDPQCCFGGIYFIEMLDRADLPA